MYNNNLITNLIEEIKKYDGIYNKIDLTQKIKDKFQLTCDRKIFYCDDFAIRFSTSKKENFSNTIISLSNLKKYDDRPFIVCNVTPEKNYLLLANTTCIKKVSHSSQQLRVDNIRGSINGSDILKTIIDIKNAPENFQDIYLIHLEYTFKENLERLVESTNNIVGNKNKFIANNVELENIFKAPNRSKSFMHSINYISLQNELNNKVKNVKNEILIASLIENVNIRGRIIEFLITCDDIEQKNKLIKALNCQEPLPRIKTEDKLGDYHKEFDNYITETDIKTKIMYLNSNPKAYNIDKLIKFLSQPNSIFLIFLVGVQANGEISTNLCSIFEKDLLSTTKINFHWSGRNSRGVTQFYGKGLHKILNSNEKTIDLDLANEFLNKMYNN